MAGRLFITSNNLPYCVITASLQRTLIRTTSPNQGISYKKRTTAINLLRISQISLVFENPNGNNQLNLGSFPRNRQRTAIKRCARE